MSDIPSPMRTLARSLLVLASFAPALGAQSAGVTVPFVGCPADGQMGYTAAPHGFPRPVSVDHAVALQLAYYSGENTAGVFAPRGWHCQVWYGSSGSTILVSAAPIDSGRFDRLNLTGQAIELMFLDGGTSGRFGVARYASRLFPKISTTFVDKVRREGIVPDSEFEPRPYPNDFIHYSDSLSAEFKTPASRSGIGTEGDLAPSKDDIRGFAVLDTSGDWGMTVFRMRVGADKERIAAAIIKLNRECIKGVHC